MKRHAGIQLKITLTLAVVVFVTAVLGMSEKASATSFNSITSDSIREKQDMITKAEEERKQLQNSLTNVKNIKAQLETEKKNLNNYVMELDGQLQLIDEHIEDLNSQIETKEWEIEETQAELQAARETEQAQYEAMVDRIQFLYEQGESTYMELIFSGNSIGDILNRMEYTEQIFAYDRRQMDDFILNRQLIEVCEQELLTEKELLNEAKEAVEAEKAAMEELIADKEQTLREYESDINNKARLIKEYEDDLKEQKEIIEALEAAIAEERKRILEANGNVLTYDGGVFKFPMASYTKVTSEFGTRKDPFLGVSKFHSGVDFAAPAGTAIYAAYDGIVVAATYSSSMGNYVMIDHGGGLYTIYMHASKLYVKKDDVVSRGSTIAAVGSTGRSTGPHLHFSVRLNGEYVSPWNYLSH